MQGTLADLSAKGPINPVLYDCCQCLFQDALFAYRIRTCYLLSEIQILYPIELMLFEIAVGIFHMVAEEGFEPSTFSL